MKYRRSSRRGHSAPWPVRCPGITVRIDASGGLPASEMAGTPAIPWLAWGPGGAGHPGLAPQAEAGGRASRDVLARASSGSGSARAAALHGVPDQPCGVGAVESLEFLDAGGRGHVDLGEPV